MKDSTSAKTKRNPRSRVPVPSSQLRIADILAILHNWGIHTLGQLAAINKEELRDRLGPDAVRLWDRANGTATRLLKFIQPPESFEESFEFDHEIETAEPLLFILRRFLDQLALRLSSIYLVARELTLTIVFANSCHDESVATATNASAARTFKIPQPTNDVDLLFRMLQTHLDNFKSEHPIVAVSLSAEPSRPASQQFGLFEIALRNPQQLYETLARLSALVGNDRIGTPVLEETHRPDAFRMEQFDWGRNDECRMTNDEGNLKPVLRRFRPPAQTSIFISEHRHLGGEAGDWGQSPLPECRRDACHHRRSDKIRGQIDDSPPGSSPSRASRPCRSAPAGSIMDQIGPFLLSGNWWDEKAWIRAEYDIQLENGELVRAHQAEGTWRLDGLYD